MTIKVRCPNCEKSMRVRSELRGRRIQCPQPNCGHKFNAPADAEDDNEPVLGPESETGLSDLVSAVESKRVDNTDPPSRPKPPAPKPKDQRDVGADSGKGGGKRSRPLDSLEFQFLAEAFDTARPLPPKPPAPKPGGLKLEVSDSLVDALDNMAELSVLPKPVPPVKPPPDARGGNRTVPLPPPAPPPAPRTAEPPVYDDPRVSANAPTMRVPTLPRDASRALVAPSLPAGVNIPNRINGTGVYLRPMIGRDLSNLDEWLDDSETLRTHKSAKLLADSRGGMELDQVGINETAITFAVCLKVNDKIVGIVGLHDIDWRNRSAGFEALISENQKVVVKETRVDAVRTMAEYGFKELSLHRQWVNVYENDPRGRKVLGEIGFTQEGRQRQAYLSEGRHWDILVWSLLAPEYFERKRSQQNRESDAD